MNPCRISRVKASVYCIDTRCTSGAVAKQSGCWTVGTSSLLVERYLRLEQAGRAMARPSSSPRPFGSPLIYVRPPGPFHHKCLPILLPRFTRSSFLAIDTPFSSPLHRSSVARASCKPIILLPVGFQHNFMPLQCLSVYDASLGRCSSQRTSSSVDRWSLR